MQTAEQKRQSFQSVRQGRLARYLAKHEHERKYPSFEHERQKGHVAQIKQKIRRMKYLIRSKP